MQSSRLIFFFKIWAVAFATTLYFAQAIIAQSHEQRLIPLSELEEQQLPSKTLSSTEEQQTVKTQA